MNVDEKTLAQIDRYLSDQMDGDERMTFEERLDKDPALQEALQMNREIHQTLADTTSLDLEKTLAALGNEFGQKYQSENADQAPQKEHKSNRTKWIIIATILVITTIVALYTLLKKQPNSQDLYANYYETYDWSDQNRSSDTTFEPNDSDWIQEYQKANFDEFLTKTNNLPDTLTNSLQYNIQFLRAMALMETQQFDASITILEELLNTSNTAYKQASAWYLALAKLHQKNTIEAIQYLERTTQLSNRGKYYSQAKRLLNELK